MRKEVYETGIPLNHIYETYYDDNNKKTMVQARKEYQGCVDWRATTYYADFGKRRRKKSTNFNTAYGSYKIEFDYYDNDHLKSANLRTDHGIIDLQYSQNGKLQTLERTVDGKKTKFNYTYAKGIELDEYSMLSAERLEDKYSNWYIDSTGGFRLFDSITNPENLAKLQEEGITVTTDIGENQRKIERKLTDEEKTAALAMLHSRETEKDSTIIYNKLEKLNSNDRQIGTDAKALEGYLVAVAKMYEHTSWTRSHSSSSCGNGEQWNYELDGAIVDIKNGEIIKEINFSEKVRDPYDGSLDTWGRINPNMMIRVEDGTVEFYMGDKHNIVASEKVDVDIALKIHESKKHINRSNQEEASKIKTPSKPSVLGGYGGHGDGR